MSNEIAVLPPGVEGHAKDVNLALDAGIENNPKAALIGSRLQDSVRVSVKNLVVTLTGEADSQSKRALPEETASQVPNAGRVVSELHIRKQKATSSK